MHAVCVAILTNFAIFTSADFSVNVQKNFVTKSEPYKLTALPVSRDILRIQKGKEKNRRKPK